MNALNTNRPATLFNFSRKIKKIVNEERFFFKTDKTYKCSFGAKRNSETESARVTNERWTLHVPGSMVAKFKKGGECPRNNGRPSHANGVWARAYTR